MIEVADKPDFADARVVVDQTAQDVPNPGTDAPWLRFTPVEGRFVRLVATRLRQRDPGNFGLAMAEMEVFSNGETLARGKNVLAADSSETGGWAAEKLVDGRLLAEPGNAGAKPEPATMLRKDFALPGAIKRATLHATGLGLYELSINGARVGENLLAPEWTLYSKRIDLLASHSQTRWLLPLHAVLLRPATPSPPPSMQHSPCSLPPRHHVLHGGEPHRAPHRTVRNQLRYR